MELWLESNLSRLEIISCHYDFQRSLSEHSKKVIKSDGREISPKFFSHREKRETGVEKSFKIRILCIKVVNSELRKSEIRSKLSKLNVTMK